jgi:hypothetical protein
MFPNPVCGVVFLQIVLLMYELCESFRMDLEGKYTYLMMFVKKKKSKAIPVTGRGGL